VFQIQFVNWLFLDTLILDLQEWYLR